MMVGRIEVSDIRSEVDNRRPVWCSEVQKSSESGIYRAGYQSWYFYTLLDALPEFHSCYYADIVVHQR